VEVPLPLLYSLVPLGRFPCGVPPFPLASGPSFFFSRFVITPVSCSSLLSILTFPLHYSPFAFFGLPPRKYLSFPKRLHHVFLFRHLLSPKLRTSSSFTGYSSFRFDLPESRCLLFLILDGPSLVLPSILRFFSCHFTTRSLVNGH